MKLWLISQNVNNDYDTFNAAVVAAETEAEARNIHPNGQSVEDNDELDNWIYSWVSPNEVTVIYLGKAATITNRGVILASFRAG
jgi:hypothetical protein